MKGDSILVEAHHRRAGRGIAELILPVLRASQQRFVITIAGESGSGKSETAQALADVLAEQGIGGFIFQQDDYFVYPPRTNDRTRREDIAWVGPGEVRLDLLDEHLQQFREGAQSIRKPLVEYSTDSIGEEQADVTGARLAIAEGTYTTLLANADSRVFIDRSYLDTRAHREKRRRDESELDEFIERVLAIEHGIISAHKARASIVVSKDYEAAPAA